MLLHMILILLQKKELGPHAHEAQMPAALVKLLEADGETKIVRRKGSDGKMKYFTVCPNRMEGILPVLEQLLTQDRSTDNAYLCHHAVRHVSKLKREGMIISTHIKNIIEASRWFLWIPQYPDVVLLHYVRQVSRM